MKKLILPFILFTLSLAAVGCAEGIAQGGEGDSTTTVDNSWVGAQADAFQAQQQAIAQQQQDLAQQSAINAQAEATQENIAQQITQNAAAADASAQAAALQAFQ